MAEAFPETLKTWIGERLADGERGREEIRQHVMTVYPEPLQIYFRGHPDRRWVDPIDAVNGFLADRLSRPDFFDCYRESGKRLRHWLIGAFRFYLHEHRRERRRASCLEPLEEVSVGAEAPPDREIDRAFVVSLVRQALAEAQEGCQEAGLGEHWDMFIGHFHAKQSYEDLGARIGVDARRASVMARTAKKRFELVICDYLERDGADPSEIASEIRSLLERP